MHFLVQGLGFVTNAGVAIVHRTSSSDTAVRPVVLGARTASCAPMLQTYIELSIAHPLLAAGLQFALLGTLGEGLSRALRARRWTWPFGLAKTLAKLFGWGLLGIYIKFMFTLATAGVEAMVSHGFLPAAAGSREGLALVLNAFTLSVVLNVFCGPSMILLHRLMDNAMDRGLDRRPAGWEGLASSLATLLWLWVPLHTITFCLPRDVRIGVAALLSLVLGVVLGALARAPTSSGSR